MDIHKPKPIHGWRDFIKELGTIALGVCIALAAEQAVEWWHWRAQVEVAREVIASEMARNISFGIERLRYARCGQSRLRAIENILDAADRHVGLPAVGQLGNALLRPWSSGAWDSVVASQAATHFPRQQLASLSLVYKQVQRVENWNRQEVDAWAILKTLSGPGRQFDPAYDTELRKSLGLARLYNNAIAVTSGRLIQSALQQDLPFTSDERRQMAVAKNTPDFAYLCEPISAKSTASGNEMSQASLSELQEGLNHLP